MGIGAGEIAAVRRFIGCNPGHGRLVACVVGGHRPLAIQPDPQFLAGGIPLLPWYAIAILSLAALIRWRVRPAPGFGPVLTLAMGAVPVPLLFESVLATYLDSTWFWIAAVGAGVYILLYLARGLRALTGGRQRVAACAGVLFILGFVGLSDTLDVIPDVWSPREAQSAQHGDAPADAEAVLFGQSERIDHALAAVGRGSSPQPRAFFLGFAGVGDEKVFAQEISLAARVLGERYEIAGRSVSLINDERDLERAPLATVTGLQYALRGLGERMNPDRDVLFLSISSHGARDPAIAVANSQLPLNDLTDEDLADVLRDSGIKWRVIIISGVLRRRIHRIAARPADHRHHRGGSRSHVVRLLQRSRPHLLRRSVLSRRIARRALVTRRLRNGQDCDCGSGTPGTRHAIQSPGVFRQGHGGKTCHDELCRTLDGTWICLPSRDTEAGEALKSPHRRR